MDHSSAARLSWVHKSDGRLVPFEADQISRDLFAASESIGQPDAFLAHELTDSILHFLALETEGAIPTTAQIVDVVVKVVRELGHPTLAQAFAQRGDAASGNPAATAFGQPELRMGLLFAQVADGLTDAPQPLAWRLSRACLHDYSLRTVFSRDLVAAHTDGLLVLGNLDSPLELAGHVLNAGELTTDGAGLVERLHDVRSLTGGFVVLDGPEHLLATAAADSRVADFARQLRLGLDGTGLTAVVNLNVELPPPGVGEPAEGPLFGGTHAPTDGRRRSAVADALVDCLLSAHAPPVRIDWHLGPRDFLAEGKGRLLRLTRRAVEGSALTFVFDRPRRPVALAEGLDRQHPAVLMTIGLNLPRLAALAETPTPEHWLQKLGSLVRLALSGATQKRDFLRRHSQARPALSRGFLRDRARLVLVPVGLEAVVRRLLSVGLADGGLSFARQIVQRLGEAIQAEGRRRYLDSCLDSADRFCLGAASDAWPSADQAAGLTAWDPRMPFRQQLRVAGQLQAETRSGTAALRVGAEQSLTAEEAVELLQWTWQHTEVQRLRIVRLTAPQRHLPALWEEQPLP